MAPNVFVESFDNRAGAIISKFPWVRAIVLVFTAAIFCGFRLRFSLFFTFFIDVSNRPITRVSMKMRGIANKLLFLFIDALFLIFTNFFDL
jgi:hypothetical protein